MDCVIRVIQGPDQGREHAVSVGAHIIGRGTKAALKLTPDDVSWEHALITREGDDYFVENLSALGTWIADAKVAGRVRLRVREKIRLSRDCVIRLEPAPGSARQLSRGLLLAALVAMLGLCCAVLFYTAGAAGSDEDNWSAAYNTLAPWIREQIASHHAPPDAADMFDRAWRVDESGDYERSIPLWVRLQVAVSADDAGLHWMELAAKDPKNRVLQELLTPKPGVAPPEQTGAAFVEFVRRRLAYAVKQTKRTFG